MTSRVHPTADLLEGAALISNTMVCEVSRLFEVSDVPRSNPYERMSDKLRIADLFSLIEALVLHEKLFTLPASLSSDAPDLRLRSRLVSAGVLEPLDTATSHPELAKLVLNGIARTPNPVRVAGSSDDIGKPIDFSGRIQKEIELFLRILESDEK